MAANHNYSCIRINGKPVLVDESARPNTRTPTPKDDRKFRKSVMDFPLPEGMEEGFMEIFG